MRRRTPKIKENEEYIKKYFLISCEHEVFCQGYEFVFEYFLVGAPSYRDAVEKLKKELCNSKNFKNHTFV